MRRRQLPIDRDELETALTWRFEEGGQFLDLETGEIVTWAGPDDDVMSEEDIDNGLFAGRLLEITPLDSSVEYGWMSEFATSVTETELARLLAVALHGRGAFRRFKDVLTDYPAERERWFAFRSERVREAAREWLQRNGIEPASSPSRKPKGAG